MQSTGKTTPSSPPPPTHTHTKTHMRARTQYSQNMFLSVLNGMKTADASRALMIAANGHFKLRNKCCEGYCIMKVM